MTEDITELPGGKVQNTVALSIDQIGAFGGRYYIVHEGHYRDQVVAVLVPQLQIRWCHQILLKGVLDYFCQQE